MFAFKREKNKLVREVLIEKIGNIHQLENFFIEDYDTVELRLTNGKVIANGVLYRYGGFRGGGNNKTLGYFSVTLFAGTEKKEFTDFGYIKRDSDLKRELFLRLFPSKCVLIEKNIITRYEDIQKEIREEWRRNPIFAGG